VSSKGDHGTEKKHFSIALWGGDAMVGRGRAVKNRIIRCKIGVGSRRRNRGGEFQEKSARGGSTVRVKDLKCFIRSGGFARKDWKRPAGPVWRRGCVLVKDGTLSAQSTFYSYIQHIHSGGTTTFQKKKKGKGNMGEEVGP